MQITVRQATASDDEAIAEVDSSARAALRRVYVPTAEALASKASQAPQTNRLVACVNGRVAGTVRYRVEDGRLHLLGLGVGEPDRQTGVARAMIEHLTKMARRQCLTRLSLYTIRQTGNVPLFQRLGFKVVSEEPAQFAVSGDGRPLTEVYMERSVMS